MNRNTKVYVGQTVWAEHHGKKRPHIVMFKTDGADNIQKYQVLVMSRQTSIHVRANYPFSKDSNIHFDRMIELDVQDIISTGEFFTKIDYDKIKSSYLGFIKKAYQYGL